MYEWRWIDEWTYNNHSSNPILCYRLTVCYVCEQKSPITQKLENILSFQVTIEWYWYFFFLWRNDFYSHTTTTKLNYGFFSYFDGYYIITNIYDSSALMIIPNFFSWFPFIHLFFFIYVDLCVLNHSCSIILFICLVIKVKSLPIFFSQLRWENLFPVTLVYVLITYIYMMKNDKQV